MTNPNNALHHRKFCRLTKENQMVDRREESSSSLSCSNVDSNESEFESPSHSASSETSTTEVHSEIEEKSTVLRALGSKRKKTQPVTLTVAVRVTTKKKRTRKDTHLKNDDKEELASWIFSAEYAAQVAAEIRQKVVESHERKHFPRGNSSQSTYSAKQKSLIISF